MIRKLIIILPTIVLFLLACNSGGEKSWADDDFVMSEDSVVEFSSDDKMQIVENIASPVEMAALIKSLGVPFSKQYLASTKNVSDYETSATRAFNLGVFGADLGYINMYNKQGMVLDYISAIKELADGINVGQFFDFQTLKRLASNSQNIDSMMYISVHSFNKMDSYLSRNNRGNLSAIMMSGVWIEGLYLGTQVANANPSEKLAQTIGEQKTIIYQLLILLDVYKSDPFIANIVSEIKTIKHLFDDIKITIEIGEPESVIKDGKLTIIQNEKSIVHMTDEQLDEIINTTLEVRNRLISKR